MKDLDGAGVGWIWMELDLDGIGVGYLRAGLHEGALPLQVVKEERVARGGGSHG